MLAKANATLEGTEEVTLEGLNREEVLRQIPLIIYLVLISGTGILGNILVLFVYKTKYGPSNCRTFLLFLSSVDLFSCALGIPFEIVFVSRQYKFRNVAACKISVLLNTWPTLTSGCVLLAIAVDRYRKVCRPFGWQISLRCSSIICVLCIILGAAFSWLSPLIYGIQKSPHNVHRNITISECVVTEKMNNDTLFPLINNICFAVLFVGALVAVSIMYCFIGAGVRAHAIRREKMRYSRPKSSTIADTSEASELTIKSGVVALGRMHKKSTKRKHEASEALFCSDSSESRNTETQSSGFEREPSLPIVHSMGPANTENNRPTSNRKSVLDRMLSIGRYSMNFLTRSASSSTSYSGNTIRRTWHNQSHSEREKARKTAFVMFLISLAFILSYLPLLCILLIRSIDTGFVDNLNDHSRAAYKFFLRSYYLNCTINPVIYGLWDAKFRKATRRFFFCRSRG